jgi:hypothetical protein
MEKALRKVIEYCDKAWKSRLTEDEIDHAVEEFLYELGRSNRDHIEHNLLTMLCGLAEDSLNGNEEAEQYYEAIMDYIMAA